MEGHEANPLNKPPKSQLTLQALSILASHTATNLSGNQIFSETVEVTSTSAEEVPEPVPEPTPQEPSVSVALPTVDLGLEVWDFEFEWHFRTPFTGFSWLSSWCRRCRGTYPNIISESPNYNSGVSCKTLYLKCWSWMLRREAACRDFNLYCKGNRAGKGYYSYSYTR